MKKCENCETENTTVSTPHRVVGEGIDVTGGPNELYCSDCAAQMIYDLRGLLSRTLNPKESGWNPHEGVFTRRESILCSLATLFADGLRTRGGKLTGTEKIALDALAEQFTNTFSSDYWEQSMGPTAHVFGSFRDLLAKRRNTTDEPYEVDGF